MNLLIVSDKADAKLYAAIAKTAPNTSVLGTVTQINQNFISVLRDKYNPHAILLDTDVTTVNADVKETAEQIKLTYPYMKLIVVTGENDTYNYPADCVIQGQISNIKLKEILQKLANGSSFVKNDSWEHESTTKGEDSQLPTRITFDRNVVDKLSTRKSNKPLFRKSKIHFNPLVLAGIVAGAIALFVIILIIIKSGSGKGQPSTTDEAIIVAATTENIEFTQDTYVTSENSTEMLTEPPSTSAPATVAPTVNAPHTILSSTEATQAKKEEKATSAAPAPVQKQTELSAVNNSSSYSNSNSNSNSNNNYSNNSNQANQPETKVYGGDPIISYDDNGRYNNAGGNNVSSIKLSYTSKTLQVGDTLQLSVTILPSQANQSVSWKSSNTSVVTVKNGLLTAKNVGSAVITATAVNGKSSSCQITVKAKEQTDNVHLSATEYHMTVGQTITVTLFGTNNCTWSYANSEPARIISKNNNQATVRARKIGKTQVFAKDNNTKKVYICDIFVE